LERTGIADERAGLLWTAYRGSGADLRGGLWSWVIRYMYANSGVLWCVDRLVDGNQPAEGMNALGYAVTESLSPRWNSAGQRERAEAARPSRYEAWYRPEDVERVRIADGLASKLGYVVPFRRSERGPLIALTNGPPPTAEAPSATEWAASRAE